MNDYFWYTFPTVGYIEYKFTDDQLLPIRNEINNIKNNFKTRTQVNETLAGNIRKEYELEESKKYIEELILPFCSNFDKHFNYTTSFNTVSKKTPLILDQCWVNFQEKYEFNPTHNHGGILSFVIWINIPYVFEEEYLASPGLHSNSPSPGSFEFVYSDCITGIKTIKINVDKNMENTMVLFPSKLLHHVYPFYTTTDYRISISGNFKFST
jgi:hypothetical protein